jgi:ketosteroid isomerase-like protein
MDNVAIIRSGYRAYDRGDMPAVLEILDPDIEWNVPTTMAPDSPFQGLDSLIGFFGALQPRWTALDLEVEEVCALPAERVLALGVYRGRDLDGRVVEIPFTHAWTLHDGHAVRFSEFADVATALRALGAAEPAAA